jgi:hypothetical protein
MLSHKQAVPYQAVPTPAQAWNISTWRAATEFFEPWFYGFASRDFIF